MNADHEDLTPEELELQHLISKRRSALNYNSGNMALRVRQHIKRRARQLFLARASAACVAMAIAVSSYMQSRQSQTPTSSPLSQQAASQASASALLSSTSIQSPQTTTLEEPILRSLQWLKTVRENDGHWSAQRWGGLQRFDVAVTSLALMPLMGAGNVLSSEELQQSAIYLQEQQRCDGGFGPAFVGDLYNHCLSSLALLQLQKIWPSKVSGTSMASALSYLLAHQNSDGGFAYREGLGAELALSLWAHDVLTHINTSAPEFVAAHHRLASWLSAHQASIATNSNTFIPTASRQWMLQYALEISPHQQSSSRQIDSWPSDIYQAYYCFRSLNLSPSADSKKMLNQLQSHLINQQENQGEYAGSWAADGQWGRVGGRVYNTGIALMCLMKDERS